MQVSVLDFFMRHVDCEEFAGRRVLEVGSKFVNGSVRPLIERFCRPREYVGIDIEAGKYVDVVLRRRDSSSISGLSPSTR